MEDLIIINHVSLTYQKPNREMRRSSGIGLRRKSPQEAVIEPLKHDWR